MCSISFFITKYQLNDNNAHTTKLQVYLCVKVNTALKAYHLLTDNSRVQLICLESVKHTLLLLTSDRLQRVQSAFYT